MTRLYRLLILALTGLIVMLEPDIAEPDAVLCDGGNEGNANTVYKSLYDVKNKYLPNQSLDFLEGKPLTDAPLPDAFQRWMDGRHD
jgi:hypothetical protein